MTRAGQLLQVLMTQLDLFIATEFVPKDKASI
jgi:hypothetical protein